MVDKQIASRGVSDTHVLNSKGGVLRDRFIHEAMSGFAYEDSPLPIEEGETTFKPFIIVIGGYYPDTNTVAALNSSWPRSR